MPRYIVKKRIDEFILSNGKNFNRIDEGSIISDKIFEGDNNAKSILLEHGFIEEYNGHVPDFGNEMLEDGAIIKLQDINIETDNKTLNETNNEQPDFAYWQSIEKREDWLKIINRIDELINYTDLTEDEVAEKVINDSQYVSDEERTNREKLKALEIKIQKQIQITKEMKEREKKTQNIAEPVIDGLYLEKIEEKVTFLVDEISKKYYIKNIDGKLYIYNEKTGLYEKNIEEYLAYEIEMIAEKNKIKTNTYLVNEVLNKLKRRTFFNITNTDDVDPYLIPLKNGYYSLKDNLFYKYNPKRIFFTQLNVKYDKNAKCPNFERFISEILPNEKNRETVLEIMAYTLFKEYPIQKCFVFYGEGSNGKTTLLEVLTQILGTNNTSHISLNKLVEDQYSLAHLYRKYANIFADNPAKAIKDDSVIKALTGGDRLTANPKFERQFTFKNYAKLIFSCNELPVSESETEAFYRRWIVVPFHVKIPEKQQDKQLVEKLTSEEEKSGILNILLDKLKALLKRGYFENELNTNEKIEMYDRMADSVKYYVENCLTQSDNGYLSKDELYEDYISFCKTNELITKCREIFFRRLKRYVQYYEVRPRNGDRNRMIGGIAIVNKIHPA